MKNTLLLLVLSLFCIGWANDGGWSSGSVVKYTSIVASGNIGLGTTAPRAKIEVDGTIYTAKVIVDGAIYIGVASLNPCATLGVGYIFFNNSGEPCYCDYSGNDIKFEDGSTACF